MLTADLLRARVRKGVVHPEYADPTPETIGGAADLIAAYRAGLNAPRQVVRQAVDDIVGHGTDFQLWRGLAKLCDDRSTFETVAPVDPSDLRQRVFEAVFAAETLPDRASVLAEVAASLGLSPQACEAMLYADLEDRQILTNFDAPTAEDLVDRYNVALAQAVLYKATRLVIRVSNPNPDRLRYVFGALKFHGLMHRARREDNGLVVELDGPASLFKLSRKYGLNLALVLPALLHLEDWEIEADLDWKGKSRTFRLTSDEGLRSHYRPRGQWRTDEEKWFEEKFASADTGWSLERRGSVVDLGDGEVLVTDYVISDEKGREALVEIVSFWRAPYLRRRIERLADVKEPIVLVVSERLKADREKLGSVNAAVVFYKGVILPSKVVEAARVAISTQT